MAPPLSGVKILEVASHVFVPIAGGILAEWGAEVIKIEHPVTGDPYRGLVTSGLHKTYNGIDPSFQYTNRGKQSVSVNLKKPEGRDLIYRLAAKCDVFLTNFRPDARRRLQIECEKRPKASGRPSSDHGSCTATHRWQRMVIWPTLRWQTDRRSHSSPRRPNSTKRPTGQHAHPSMANTPRQPCLALVCRGRKSRH